MGGVMRGKATTTIQGLGDKRIVLGGGISSKENKMADIVLNNIGWTLYGITSGWQKKNPPGIFDFNGVLVLMAKTQKEIAPANKRAAIKKIQKALKLLGLLPKDVSPTGNYGPKTKIAVKKFQSKIGAVGSKDGEIIGKHTVDALMRAVVVCKRSGDVNSWVGSLIYISTGIKLDPPTDQVKDTPPSVYAMLSRRITESGNFSKTLAGKTAFKYNPNGISQENKTLYASLWVIGKGWYAKGMKVDTSSVLGELIKAAGGSYGNTVGPKSLKVIIRALEISNRDKVKSLDPWTRAEYIKNQLKGTWGK